MAEVPAYLAAMFNQIGMPELSQWYLNMVTGVGTPDGKPATDAQVMLDLPNQPAYIARFPAMAALHARGEMINEQQYASIEKSYKQALEAYGLRGSAYDSAATYTQLMTSGVDVQELEERLQDAKMVTDATDPNIRTMLLQTYGIGSTDLLAYALDPAGRGKDHVEKLARSATLQGLARTMSLNMSQQYAENLAMDTSFDNSTEAGYRDAMSNVAQLSTSQRRLASIEGEAFTDEDAADVVVKNDAKKMLASRERAAREAARFSGSSGLSSATLRGPGI